MKAKQFFITSSLAVLMVANLCWAKEPPKMKMTTEVPPGIATPDKFETRFGALNFFDGVPDKATVQKVYDHLDFQHSFQAFLSGIQIASMDATAERNPGIRAGQYYGGPF